MSNDSTRTFNAAPNAAITGTPNVGQPLSATDSTTNLTPVPHEVRYRWYADGTGIAGSPRSHVHPHRRPARHADHRAGDRNQGRLHPHGRHLEPHRHGHADRDPVTGTPVITGTAKVGQTLNADTTSVSSTPSSTRSGQWLRDGVAIPDADGATYELTNADAGATLTYRRSGGHRLRRCPRGQQRTRARHRWTHHPADTGRVRNPGRRPAAHPVPAHRSAADPGRHAGDLHVAARRDRGGTGETYTPTADDAGHTLRATARATRASYEDATAFVDTAVVAPASSPRCRHRSSPAP